MIVFRTFLHTQPAFTCSKLAIETLEKRCGICPKLTIKTPPFSRLSIVEFKQVNTGWVRTTWIIP